MSKKQLKRRIAELERRVQELEEQKSWIYVMPSYPVYPPVYPAPVWPDPIPWQPRITWDYPRWDDTTHVPSVTVSSAGTLKV